MAEEKKPSKSAKRYANPPGKDGKKKPMPKEGGEKVSAPETKKDGTGEGKTPGAEPNPETGVEDAKTQMAGRHAGERKELIARHDKERAQMHGRHETDHKAMAKRHAEEAGKAGFLGGITTGMASGPEGAGADGTGPGGGT